MIMELEEGAVITSHVSGRGNVLSSVVSVYVFACTLD